MEGCPLAEGAVRIALLALAVAELDAHQPPAETTIRPPWWRVLFGG